MIQNIEKRLLRENVVAVIITTKNNNMRYQMREIVILMISTEETYSSKYKSIVVDKYICKYIFFFKY